MFPLLALLQDSGISEDPSGHSALFWLVVVAVVVGVFFGGRWLYRKYASPQQKSS